MKAPKNFVHITAKQDSTTEDHIIYNFYKHFISPVDGDRCIMYPSCSLYAKYAIEKHGVFVGFLVISDRLTRCGNDLIFYQKIIGNGKEYFFDPLFKEKDRDK